MGDATGAEVRPPERSRPDARVSLPQDLRHCFASLLIADGLDVKVVQARLRHASASEPIENHLRAGEDAPVGTHLFLRGSPLTAEKFAEHSARTARAYRGEPCFGISVEQSSSRAVEQSSGPADTAHLLQGRRLSSRHRVARIRVEDASNAGFVLLPTFGAPHYTVVTGHAPTATVEVLAVLAARDVVENPYYQGGKEV